MHLIHPKDILEDVPFMTTYCRVILLPFCFHRKKCLVLTTAGKILKYFTILNFGYITQKLSEKETKFKIEICNGDTHNLGGLNHANIQDVSIAYLSRLTIKEEHKW